MRRTDLASILLGLIILVLPNAMYRSAVQPLSWPRPIYLATEALMLWGLVAVYAAIHGYKFSRGESLAGAFRSAILGTTPLLAYWVYLAATGKEGKLIIAVYLMELMILIMVLLVARYLGKHASGKPFYFIEYMPGASPREPPQP